LIISLIVAISQNNVIGKAGDIPWHIPADMRHFKETTMGKPVIMGRKTWDSLGKPLPKRTNIVITRNEAFKVEGVERAPRFEDALELARNLTPQPEEIVIIGGSGIYRLGLPHADRIYLTRVHGAMEGDTFFPEFDEKDWHLSESKFIAKEGKATHDCTILTYNRREA